EELRLSHPSHPRGGGGQRLQGNRLDSHDQPSGATRSQGHSVPSGGDASGVSRGARQGALELSQLAAATRGATAPGGAARRGQRGRTTAQDRQMVAANSRRQQKRSGVSAADVRVGPGRKRQRQLPGAEMS